MTRIRVLCLVACLAVVNAAMAAPITEGQARNIALQFMSKQVPSLKLAPQASMRATSPVTGKAAYYVFNAAAANKGYVIVAGDDRVPAVLGYSDNGTFDSQDVPQGMMTLLEGYAAQIEALDQGAKAAPHLVGNQAIPPLVTAAWNQDFPYNILFPMVGNNNQAVVGCVATAFAQILYYWKHPAQPTAPIPAYTSRTKGIYMPQLPVIDFDWEGMQDTYLYDDFSDGALAAAELSLYCAQSVYMDFGDYESGAYTHDVVPALINYFGYKPTAKYVSRDLYTTQQWEDMVYGELAAGRPVLYSGSKENGGHAYVCDGYDGQGRFHINWGWNGVSNGYFLLSVLNPDEQGTGSASGAYGYILNQAIVMGIEPGTGTQPNEFALTVNRFEMTHSTPTRSGTNYNFSVSLNTHFINGTTNTYGFKYGWGLYKYKNGTLNLEKVLSSGSVPSLPPQYFIEESRTLQFGANIYSGTYRIIPIYCEYSGSSWRPCVGYSMNYIDISFTGNNCTIHAHGIGNTPSYTVNDIAVNGHMHARRPVRINLDLTNSGYTHNDIIYMFANGTLHSMAFVDIEPGANGNAEFMYTNSRAGTYTLTFSLSRDGSNVIATQPVTLTAMPSASLSSTIEVLNVVNPASRIIGSDKFSLLVTVKNIGTTTYDEDITVKLNKQLMDNYGSIIQTVNRSVSLEPQESTTLQFDLDNVTDRWMYSARVYFYTSGSEILLRDTGFYTLYFSDWPVGIYGDVNNDGEVNIGDVNTVIGIILGKSYDSGTMQRADVDGNGEVNIGDVNAIIKVLLS